MGGEWFNDLTAEESAAVVDAAQEHGINYIDIFMLHEARRLLKKQLGGDQL